MTPRETLTELICTAAARGTLRRLTLSKPVSGAAVRVVGRLSVARGQNVLAMEETLGGGKVRHSALRVETLCDTLPALTALEMGSIEYGSLHLSVLYVANAVLLVILVIVLGISYLLKRRLATHEN